MLSSLFAILLSTICLEFAVYSYAEEASTVAEVSQTKRKADFFEGRVYGKLEVEVLRFELLDVVPGTKKHATVLLHNRSSGNLGLKQVRVACKCTEAKVPKTVLAPQDFVQCEFNFEIAENSRKVREIFSATIECDGHEITSAIEIRFVAEFKDAVCFPQPDVSIGFSETSPLEQFKLPILCASPDAMEGIKVEVTDDLSLGTAKLISDNNQFFVIYEFVPRNLVSEAVGGEFQLKRNDKILSTTMCFLQKKQAIEFLPNNIVLFPSEIASEVREGSLLVKIRKNQGKKLLELRDLTCEIIPGKPIAIRVSDLSQGCYRITLSVKDEQELLEIRKRQGLIWSLTLSNGEVVKYESKITVSN